MFKWTSTSHYHSLRSTLTANSFCRCATRRFPAFEPLTVGVSDVLTDGYFKLAMELGFEFQAGLNGKCRVTSPVFRWARGRTSSCPNINDNLGSESTWELYWKRVAAFYSTHSLLRVLAPRNAMGPGRTHVSLHDSAYLSINDHSDHQNLMRLISLKKTCLGIVT